MFFKTLQSELNNMPFRFCPICDAICTSEIPVCRFCQNLIQDQVFQSSLRFVVIENIKVHPLFVWDEQNNNLIQCLIYHLKSGKDATLLQWLVHLFSLKFSYLLSPSQVRFFVPAPSSKEGHSDHASKWGKEFSFQWKGIYFSPLKRRQEGEQKQKKQQERSNIRLAWAQAQVRLSRRYFRDSLVCFCDDVVTTGSTLKSAYQVLGKPEKFQCFTIAYRQRLASQLGTSFAVNIPVENNSNTIKL